MKETCHHLSELAGVTHGFFTRNGGVSEGVYTSLNCGAGSGDTLEHVRKNRATVAEALGAKPEALVTAYQIHSPQAVVVKKPWDMKEAPQADALVTDVPGIAVGVLTADCLPILIADARQGVIAAIHAGWKGAFDGVIEAAISCMLQLGASTHDMFCAIGPAIEQKSYEVGPEFYARFLQQDIVNTRYFLPAAREAHYMFDLKGYAEGRLTHAGVPTINILAHDTCSDENTFFSFRRATLKKEPVYGRQISAICLEDS